VKSNSVSKYILIHDPEDLQNIVLKSKNSLLEYLMILLVERETRTASTDFSSL
jgi:hypothetical protein